MKRPSALSQAILTQIAHAIASLQHGSVHITIQDSKVIQIEKAEKIRVKHGADLTPGGSQAYLSLADQTTGGLRPLSEGGWDG